MLAARDQENLIHGRQAAAASKPLNGGNKHAPKTPGAKTPFKARQHDENAVGVTGGGKPGLLGREKGGKLGGGVDRNAFVTPLGPRTRAPLGFKTTNAKTKGGSAQGVAPDKSQGRENDAKSRKPKPKVAQKVALQAGPIDDAEREIEYMPPRAKEMPDYPDDFPPDTDFSILETLHTSNEWLAGSADPIGYDGITDLQRKLAKEEEQHLRSQEADEDKLARAISKMTFPGMDDILGISRPATSASRKNGTILEPRKAVQALADRSKLSKAPTSAVVRSKKSVFTTTKARPNMAAVASKSTIGYSNGRVTSASMTRGQKQPGQAAKISANRASSSVIPHSLQGILRQDWEEDLEKIEAPTLSELLRDEEAEKDFEL